MTPVTGESAFGRMLQYCPSIADLILEPRISEVWVNPDRGIFLEQNGVTVGPVGTAKEGEVEDFCKHAARWLGRDISERAPLLSTRLSDGSRISVTSPPVSPDWCVAIRKFGERRFSLDDLVALKTLPVHVATLLRTVIWERLNVIISGSPGAGKTTILNALLNEVSDVERVVLIEDTSEIHCTKANLVRFEAWGGLPNSPPVSIRDLLKHSLRFSPNRLIVGEVRDFAAFDLLQALNTGHSGSFSTVHADNALSALERIASLALSAHSNLNHAFVKAETAKAINYVVHAGRDITGERCVQEVIRVDEYSHVENKFLAEQVYKKGIVSHAG